MIGAVYTSCADLPLSRFVKILVTGDTTKLVKWGWVSRDDLARIWNSIFNEYTELSKDTTHVHFLDLMKEYTSIRNKLSILDHIVGSLTKHINKDLITVLKKMGFNYKYTSESLKGDIEKIVARAKALVFRAEKLQKELTVTKGGSVTAADFDDLLAELGAFQGYHIEPAKTTVAQFVSLVNRFKKHVEHGKSGKNNRVNR